MYLVRRVLAVGIYQNFLFIPSQLSQIYDAIPITNYGILTYHIVQNQRVFN